MQFHYKQTRNWQRKFRPCFHRIEIQYYGASTKRFLTKSSSNIKYDQANLNRVLIILKNTIDKIILHGKNKLSKFSLTVIVLVIAGENYIIRNVRKFIKFLCHRSNVKFDDIYYVFK